MLQSTKTGSEMFELSGLGKTPCNSHDIRNFVDLLANVYFFDGPDRRAEPRMRITLPLIIDRLDEQGRRLAHQVRAVTRDLSQSGIGLVCEDPVGTRFVSFQLASPCGTTLDLVAEVLRCEPFGYYYNVGCEFVVAVDP